ncbi:MAG: hypothetical protein JWQ49_3221 [Edaphobacter sp.]|nr:hypothetical protein [Edaphobacter sp.]
METSLYSAELVLRLASEQMLILWLRGMRRVAILLLLVGSALSSAAVRPVTAEQLEQILAATHNAPDAQVAAQISDLTLIERLSPAVLTRCEASLAGPRARQAFMALVDMSAFLDPPAAQMPALPKPDSEAQRKMIALTVDYVSKTIHQLPNFYATRVTTTFQDNPSFDESKMSDRRKIPNIFIISKPLHPVARYSATVLYRKGREEVHAEAAQSRARGLTSSGEFGPILSMSLLDAAQGHLVWSRWEQGAAGPEAVFRFAVSAEKSHYEVSYCCIIKTDGVRVYYRQFSAYEGEITIDPSNGTVLRLSLKATGLRNTDPIVKANIMVEYGPVELGGRTYICPLKGIALSLASEVQPSLGAREEDFPPLQTSLNEVIFEQYHLYHAESHVLPGYTKEQLQKPPEDSKPPD